MGLLDDGWIWGWRWGSVQGEVSEAAESKAAVAARETAPAVVEEVRGCFGADCVVDEGVFRGV